MIGYVAVMAVGYVMGTKAGRRRYEQISGTYRAVTSSPAARAVIETSRRKIAERVSPDPQLTTLTTLTSIDEKTTVLHPEARTEK